MLNTAENRQELKYAELRGIYARLMVARSGLRNDSTLAMMLASVCVGDGAMPMHLGLSNDGFMRLMQRHFPGAELPMSYIEHDSVADERFAEQDDLRQLLLEHRAGEDEEVEWMADILVAGCMGGDHLWQDLGLWSRKDLSALIQTNFPQLAAKNDKDMKWKKFFYKQLCQREGIYVCRSPSCEVCPDYSGCFGPEE